MRITGGVHRSRRLVAPRGAATRPTSDRVREALFSILAARGSLSGAVVLDLYAGTGALGLEALSRGAARAVFVESDREAGAALSRNLAALGEEGRARVIDARVERASKRLGPDPFDLVLTDPPYAIVAEAAEALAGLVAGAAVAAGATVVLEHASRTPAPEVPGLTLDDTRVYGDTALAFYTH